MLPKQKTKAKVDLSDYSVLIHGRPKIGKSTWCSHSDDALFLAFEPGLNALEVYQMPVDSWEHFCDILKEITEGKHPFKTIVIDTVDIAYRMCADFVCKKFSVIHQSDLAYGKGPSLVNNEFHRVLAKLAKLPYGVILVSRLSWFQSIDRPALHPLAQTRYVFAEWKKARVNIDYHIELFRHYYSVPYQLVKEEVTIRFTSATVEIFRRGKRVTSHKRDNRPGRHTTLKEHMPEPHQRYLEWTPSRIVRWASHVGQSTAELVEIIMNSRKHPQQGYRSCMGIMRLGKQYSPERLEKACQRAIIIGGYSYKSVRSILEKGLDKLTLPHSEPIQSTPIDHHNIRGIKYYH